MLKFKVYSGSGFNTKWFDNIDSADRYAHNLSNQIFQASVYLATVNSDSTELVICKYRCGCVVNGSLLKYITERGDVKEL